MTLAALQDLFLHHRDRATGLWKVGTEPNRVVFFECGDIVFAQSTHPSDRLTYLLVERGKLTQAQLDYALANLKPGFSIGKNLIEMGFITQRDLLDVARAQVERVVQGALGTSGLVPSFEAQELDATVVRLPMDTPQLLLHSLLALQDRELLLELLGPLNQVVVLQGRRLMEMNLPSDLAKLPPLLDGTHTLLELCRETSLEPLRLGVFALFLREIGWARLHELPPLDRRALDRALTAELEPLSPPLPEPALETVPSLFSTIEAAAKPTTNLEHLSQALDDLEELQEEPPEEELLLEEDTPVSQMIPEPGPQPAPPPPPGTVDASGFEAETGRAILPTPSMELPEPPSMPDERPEPEVVIQPSTLTVAPAVPAPALDQEPRKGGTKGRMAGLSVLALAALLAGGWWWSHRRSGPRPPLPPPPAQAPAPPPSQAAPPPPGSMPAQPGIAVPPPPGPPKPEPAAEVVTTPEARAEALRRGDLEMAIKQGQKYVAEGPAGQWTLRLEIACMGETLSKAVALFGDGRPDLFVVPMTLLDGRSCYQVFYGKFPSGASAEKAAAALPKAFHEAGNRPKAFLVSELPSKQ